MTCHSSRIMSASIKVMLHNMLWKMFNSFPGWPDRQTHSLSNMYGTCCMYWCIGEFIYNNPTILTICLILSKYVVAIFFFVNISLHLHLDLYLHVQLYVHLCFYLHLCLHLYLYLHLYISTYICVYTSIPTYLCFYISIYLSLNLYIFNKKVIKI